VDVGEEKGVRKKGTLGFVLESIEEGVDYGRDMRVGLIVRG
jgi:hypothetical protein